MLTHLHIRNLAVLDEVEIELTSGFTALTGETGAGKSMLVDALALALGERADSGAVRAGADRTEVTAVFDLDAREDVTTWLGEHDLDAPRECRLRRVITGEGRSRGYVNGQSVPMETLRELGERLVEICSQQAHLSLRHRAALRALLDSHGAHQPLLDRMQSAHEAWRQAETERTALQESRRDRHARRELLAYQVRELEALNLQPGEAAELEREHCLLANRERIAGGLTSAHARLYDDEQLSAHDALSAARRELEGLASLDATLAPAAALLAQAEIQLSEAAETIRRRLGTMEHDPGRQQAVEARLATIEEIARKHRIGAEELAALAGRLSDELAQLAGGDARLEQLEGECDRLQVQMLAAGAELSRARQAAANSLTRAVTARLRSLGMPHSEFRVQVESLPSGQIGPAGADQIEFLVATSPGQTPGPVARVASGGELSRVSLAVQVVAMATNGAPTLVFDEADAGVGGGVAEIVGQCLRSLSRQRQVLCVTHLAQVASQADQQIAVTKASEGGIARTRVQNLAAPERVEEIARMLGGLKITARTRAHASEMLTSARSRRAG